MKKTDQESFPLVVYSPNTYNSQNWTRPKPRARLPMWASGTQVLEPFPVTSQGALESAVALRFEPRDSNIGYGLCHQCYAKPSHQNLHFTVGGAH